MPQDPPSAKTLEQAIALHQAGHLADAERLYRSVLAEDDGNADSLHLIGVIRIQQGKAAEAVDFIERALERNPHYAAAHSNLAKALCDLGRYEDAVTHCRSSIEINPASADAHYNLATTFSALKRHEDAVPHYRNAAALNPVWAEAHYGLGNALYACGRYEEAAESFRKASSIRPEWAAPHCDLGNALDELDRPDEAIASYHKALAIAPDHADAYYNSGTILMDRNRHAEAVAYYEKALALRPDWVDAHLNQGMALLAMGEYGEGWKKFEWRARQKDSVAALCRFDRPQWQGEKLSGATILLHSEQGLGDTLQFVRYAPLVARRGGRVILACQASLKRLLGQIEGVAHVMALGEPWPDFDLHCPLMSLPLVFGTTLADIPCSIPYLRAFPEDAALWNESVGTRPGLRIGLAWSAGVRDHRPNANRADRRNIALARFAPLGRVTGVRFFSLQKGTAAAQATSPPPGMILEDYSDELLDFADTAALVEQLDLVITVDTSVAHLAGSMGKPVWILLRFDGCWRWLLDRDDSPWYPTAKLYRQRRIGDWDGVLERVSSDVRALSRMPR